MEEIEKTKFNICLLGDCGVGKTHICSVQCGEEFDGQSRITIGFNYMQNSYVIDGKEYNFKIFDTAGQEQFKAMSMQTIHIADGFLVIFDVTDKDSFKNLDFWVNCINQGCNIDDKAVMLIGNKVDKDNREVTEQEAVDYARKNKMKYFEVSAKDKINIHAAFQNIYIDVYNKYQMIKKNEDERRRTSVTISRDKIIKKKKRKFC